MNMIALAENIRKVIATRFLMLLALVGAFWLGNRAMDAQSMASLFVLVAYCFLTILPLVYIELASRSKGS